MNHKYISVHTDPNIPPNSVDLLFETLTSPQSTPVEKRTKVVDFYNQYLTPYSQGLTPEIRKLLGKLNNDDGINSLIDLFRSIGIKYSEEYHYEYPLDAKAGDATAEILNKISAIDIETLNKLMANPKMEPIIHHIQLLHRMDDWC
jgi:hypothetical protein